MSPRARGVMSWRERTARDGLVLSAGMVLSGVLDYATNVVVGRRLAPVEFGVFVTVMAVVQVLTLLSIALRMVVAFYTAELTAHPDGAARCGAFLRVAARWSLRWGLVATAVVAAASPLVASALRLPHAWPLWAATPIVLMLFLRETAFGTLQGVQAFGALGGVQVAQAVLRIVATVALMEVARTASAAIAAQPIAALACVALSAAWLRANIEMGGDAHDVTPARRVSWRYSVSTVVGLAVFGLLTNADALFVRRYFSPEVAGDYGPVVTLAKISLFLPWAIGLVLFPKVARRRAAGRDSRALLVLAMGAALAPGLAVSAVYFLAPGTLVRAVFSAAYADPGIVLGLASLAGTLYAGIHIWLNYALSLERQSYVYVLSGILAAQGVGMYLLGRQGLVPMTLVMVVAALAGNIAGYATTRSLAPSTKGATAEAVPS